MPRYLTQFTVSPQAVATVLQNPQNREEVLRPLVESMGGKLEQYYFEIGGDTGYMVVELPDNDSAGMLSLAVFAGGALTSIKSVPIMTASEAEEMYRKAASVVYQPPSA